MTTFDIKTALESEANAVIDALKLAFVADPVRHDGYGQTHRNTFYTFQVLPKPLEGRRFLIRVLITLGTIQVQLYGFLHM